MWPHLYLAGSAEGGRRGITVEVVLLQLEHGSGEMMEVARSSTIEVAGPETLMQAICNALPQDIVAAMADDLKCYSGDAQGEELTTDMRLLDVDSIMEAHRRRSKSVLFVCKQGSSGRTYSEGASSEEGSSGISSSDSVTSISEPQELEALGSVHVHSSSAAVARTGSFMVQELMRQASLSRTQGVSNGYNDEESEGRDFFPSSNPPSPFEGSVDSRSRTLRRDDTLPCVRPSSPRGHSTLHHASLTASASLAHLGLDSVPHRDKLKRPKRKYKNRFSEIWSPIQTSPRHNSRIPEHASKDKFISISRPQPPLESAPLTSEEPTSPKSWTRRNRRAIRKRSSTISDDLPMEIQVVTEDNSRLMIVCHDRYSVSELKQNIARELDQHYHRPRELGHWRTRDFSISYSLDGTSYELVNDSQLLFNTTFFQKTMTMNSDITLNLVETHCLPRRELCMLSRLCHLSGVSLEERAASLHLNPRAFRPIPPGDRAEANWARRALYDHVVGVVRERDEESYSLSVDMNPGPVSMLLALKIPLDNKISISFHYKELFSLKRAVSVQSYAESMLMEIFPIVVACGLVEGRVSDFTLQVTGKESYIHGPVELITFSHIRRSIMKGDAIHLSVTLKPSIELCSPFQYSSLPLDSCSNNAPLYSDISARKPLLHTRTTAIWDHEDKFSFDLSTLENLPPPTKAKSGGFSSVHVRAYLCLGARYLCAPVILRAVPLQASKIVWEGHITFDLQKRDLPKAAKILLVVKEGSDRIQSESKSESKFLFWGLVSVFNQVGMLISGEHRAALWRGRKTKTVDTEEVVELNQLAPAVCNPHPSAVTATLLFPQAAVPCFFPSVQKESREGYFSLHHAARAIDLKRSFVRMASGIKEGLLSVEKLPASIARIQWGSHSEVLQVYSLLDQLQEGEDNPVPTEVALELLDSTFPDEYVREFAVAVLEPLPDSKLEDLLLQLVQVIKFEARHDSALARFLLTRALRSKRIAHFFFWYLKCETSYPLFRTRFAVVLEAYLKGCGEDMLTQFKDQVEIQTVLEDIAGRLKESTRDPGKMQAQLIDLLHTHSANKFNFVPAFDPRSRLGNMRINKCRVLSSAKRPIWLELLNTHGSVLGQEPVGLILKLGDDLRQDMITLRLLSLFEKIWDEQGLDLCLIPYGCMATGPTSGFIEVVKNARTISEVSGVMDEKKLLEWITSHQINDFGEVDQEKVDAAIKRFTQSCAGYSVATYVLGIGDRHNDNIMVTTSGNLFHIDFGHFLGNIKHFMKIKREWVPFVLTPDFVHVMGGENGEMFKLYKNYCCRAFLALRRQAGLIINLFSLMRSTGIPELTCVDDTNYIREVLLLAVKSDRVAEEAFLGTIQECLRLKWTVQVMWMIHTIKHNKGSS